MEVLAYTLGAVLFFVGVLTSIALHEIGHLLPAKLFDVKTTQYMVGFGKTIWSRQRGETEYGVKAIPLGGYVRLVGMLPPPKGEDQQHPTKIRKYGTGMFRSVVEDARSTEYEHVDPEDGDRLFYRKPWWQKLIIMSGGPAMNVVLAFLILGGIFMTYGVYEPKPVVSAVSDCVIPATDAGRECTEQDPVSPAAQAGIQIGDRIVSFNGEPIGSWDELTEVIRANSDGAATIVVERDGTELTLQTSTTVAVRPDLDDPSGQTVAETGFLGVSPVQELERQGPLFVLTTMWDYTEATAVAIWNFPEKLVGVWGAAFGGEERSADSPMSVVGASRVAGEIASDNTTEDGEYISVGARVVSMLSLLGIVNLFVALFNLIPLLPLDGGHIAGALFEAVKRAWAKVRGKPDPGYVDVAKLLPIAYVMATLLILVGVLLLYADLVNPVRLSSG